MLNISNAPSLLKNNNIYVIPKKPKLVTWKCLRTLFNQVDHVYISNFSQIRKSQGYVSKKIKLKKVRM